jgi:uncharacterized protein
MLAEYIQKPQLETLVATAASIQESLEIGALPRLRAMLHESSSVSDLLQIEIRFAVSDAHDTPVLRLHVQGSLNLQCQRCLGPLVWSVDLHCELFVLLDDSQAEGFSELFDAILLDDDGLHLLTVIEDELMGSVPFAPSHDSQSGCTAIAGDAQAAESTKPFAGLANMFEQANRLKN